MTGLEVLLSIALVVLAVVAFLNYFDLLNQRALVDALGVSNAQKSRVIEEQRQQIDELLRTRRRATRERVLGIIEGQRDAE